MVPIILSSYDKSMLQSGTQSVQGLCSEQEFVCVEGKRGAERSRMAREAEKETPIIARLGQWVEGEETDSRDNCPEAVHLMDS